MNTYNAAVQVLHLRAEMHLLDEAPAYTLNCIRILRNMPHALASSPGVSLTALKAAMQVGAYLGRLDLPMMHLVLLCAVLQCTDLQHTDT